MSTRNWVVLATAVLCLLWVPIAVQSREMLILTAIAAGFLYFASNNIWKWFNRLFDERGNYIGSSEKFVKQPTFSPAWTQPTARPNPSLVYTIKLPRKTAWNAEHAIALIQQLCSMGDFVLRIAGRPTEIVWQIIDLNKDPYAGFVTKAVQVAYPEAEVSEPVAYDEPPFKAPYYRFTVVFNLLNIYPVPLTTARQLKGNDPISLLTNMMSNLLPGEWVNYSIYLAKDNPEVLQLKGHELLKNSKWRDVASAFISSASSMTERGLWEGTGAAFREVIWGKGSAKYIEPDMNLMQTKLQETSLNRYCIVFEVNTPEPDRIVHFNIEVPLAGFQTANQLLDVRDEKDLRTDEVHDQLESTRTSSMALIRSYRITPRDIVDKGDCALSPSEAAALWHLPYEAFTAAEIAWIKGHQVAAPPAFCGKREGVLIGVNKAGGRSNEIYQPTSERTSHTLILGKTGVGKTSFMQALVAQDIEAGRGVAVVDPLGRYIRRILQHNIPAGREDDVVILDIDFEFDEAGKRVRYPPPLNLLARPRGIEDSIAAGNTVSVLSKIYEGFDTTRYANILTNALITLTAEEHPTLLDIESVITDEEYRNRLLSKIDNLGVQRFWSRFDEQAGMQHSSIDAALHRLDPFYNNSNLAAITCHPDPLDFEQLMGENKIILVSVHADEKRVPELQRNILGATVVSQLQMAALADAIRNPKNDPFLLYVDEVQAFVTSALDEVARQARQKGLGLVVATQYLKSLSSKTLDAFLGTVGTICAFECEDADARLVLSQMKPFEVSDLTNLGKYRAVVSMRSPDGTSRAAFNLEPVAAPDVSDDPKDLEREVYLRRKSVQNYTPKPYGEVKAWLDERYNPKSKKASPLSDAPSSDPFTDPV